MFALTMARRDEEMVKDFDTRAYVAEKLESAFLEVQADISLAVQNNVAQIIESIEG